ncbi:MAG TPA: glycosyltransferase [Jatrophihabitantaceae bacterium]|nr:glycosyltransferase [Jatrophihabitantaceae bacterium]
MGLRRDGDGCFAARAIAVEVALKAATLGSALAIAATAHAAVNTRLLRRVPAGQPASSVSVLIPARDEAATIDACLASIDAGPEVLVLDDGSRDDTAARAEARGVRVVVGEPLPPGWLGKPHACMQLAAAAAGDVLVFLDADVRLSPGAVDSAVALLETSGLDLVSPHPRQEVATVAERLVQPLLQWSILTFLPLRLAERSRRPSLAAANGQFLVVRRAAYERAGGHVPDAVLDDLALLRAIKRAGGHGALVDGTDLASCRMYAGWAGVRDGYAKSLWSAFGSPVRSAAVLGALALAYLVPPLAALRGSRIGALGYAAAVVGRVITARRTGGRVADAPWQPASIAVLGYLTARSHVLHQRGSLRWKGRAVS